ncbi:MAG TPA: hypothetical protein GXX20_07535 [Clostridiaceae bacterium]|nr:hypothetical protein [Clostridiaceae bacterium]
MKQLKLYNVIFPLWFIMFFPPVVFITLAGNFIIDSLVIVACFFIYKLAGTGNNLKTFYTKSVFQVWIFGFISDIIGATILFLFGMFGDYFGLPYEMANGINFDPYSYPWAIVIIVLSMLIAAIFIFIFNYKITLREMDDRKLRFKVAITLAIITMPWTFLLPTKWFY